MIVSIWNLYTIPVSDDVYVTVVVRADGLICKEIDIVIFDVKEVSVVRPFYSLNPTKAHPFTFDGTSHFKPIVVLVDVLLS